MSSAYESLHINTSRQMMEYAAYPMPESLPDYPDHRQVAQYFDDFVDHFGPAGDHHLPHRGDQGRTTRRAGTT